MSILRDVMVADVRWVAGSALVRHAAALMADHEIGSVLVEDKNGTPVGIVTETDLVRRIIAEDRHPWATRVDQVMNPSIVTLEETRLLNEAVTLMATRNIRHLGVTKDGDIVGVVVARDVLTKEAMPVAPVRKIMSRLVATIPMHGTVREAATRMTEATVGSVLVTGRRVRMRPGQRRIGRDSDIAGIVTEGDLVRKLVATDRYPYVTPVADLMETHLQTIDAEEPVRAAGVLMAHEGIRHLIVTEGPEEIVGLLSMRDILRSTSESTSVKTEPS